MLKHRPSKFNDRDLGCFELKEIQNLDMFTF